MHDLREEPPFYASARFPAEAHQRQFTAAMLSDVDQLAARVDALQQALIHTGERLGPLADFAAALPADAIRTLARHWLDTATDVPLETRRAVYAELLRWLDGQPL